MVAAYFCFLVLLAAHYTTFVWSEIEVDALDSGVLTLDKEPVTSGFPILYTGVGITTSLGSSDRSLTTASGPLLLVSVPTTFVWFWFEQVEMYKSLVLLFRGCLLAGRPSFVKCPLWSIYTGIGFTLLCTTVGWFRDLHTALVCMTIVVKLNSLILYSSSHLCVALVITMDNVFEDASSSLGAEAWEAGGR